MKIIYAKYSKDRKPRFQIKTTIFEQDGKIFTKKNPLNIEGKKHIEKIYKNFMILSKKYENVNLTPPIFNKNEIIFEYEHGITLDKVLINLVFQNNKVEFLNKLHWYKEFAEGLNNGFYREFKLTSEFIEIFGHQEVLLGQKCLDVSNIDMSFDNLIIDGGKNKIIDYEWVFEFELPIEFIIYRAVTNFYYKYYKYMEKFIGIFSIFDFLDIAKDRIQTYDLMEEKFAEYVFDKNSEKIANGYLKSCNKIDLNVKNDANFMQIFINDGTGFSEKNSIRKKIDIQETKFSFDISSFSNVEAIRIDPIDFSCILDINKILLLDKNNNSIEYKEMTQTSEFNLGSCYIFLRDDPQIFINLSGNKEISKINIYLEILETNIKDKKYFEYFRNLIRNLEENFSEEEQVIKKLNMELESKANVVLARESKIQSIERDNKILKDKLESGIIELENVKEKLNNIYKSKWWKVRCIFKK